MRTTLFLLLAGVALAQAAGPEMGLQERLNYRPPMVGEKITKENQAWTNPEANKKFQGKSDLKVKEASETTGSFKTKSFGSESFVTRSFFSIKNPWFGKKVYDTKDDDWSKTTLADSKNTYKVETAQTREFAQSKKGAAITDVPVATKSTTVQGKAQGALDDTKKNLSIDEVREILNKNH